LTTDNTDEEEKIGISRKGAKAQRRGRRKGHGGNTDENTDERQKNKRAEK